MNFDFSCTASRIMLDLPHQIWEAEAADPAGQIFITRMFHNKIGFYLSNYLRCYLSYFSPEQLGFIISILFYVSVYYLIAKKSKLFIILMLAPLPALLEFFPVVLRGIILICGYIMTIIVGFYYFYEGRKLKHKRS